MGRIGNKTGQVLVREWESGDWVEVYWNGELRHQGHSVPNEEWINLLREAGAGVKVVEVVTDEDGCNEKDGEVKEDE